MNNNKGMMIGVVIGIVVIAGGIFAYQNSQQKMMQQEETMMKQDSMKKEETSGDSMMEKDDTMMKDETSMMKTSYTGKKLAGTSSQYLEFTQADYVQAQKDGKIIFLDFYADWCPICRAEAPAIQEGFDNLNNENVVGFRVNFKDAQTDDAEKALAKEFNIPTQHTKVVLKDGKEILRSSDAWDADTFASEMKTVLTK